MTVYFEQNPTKKYSIDNIPKRVSRYNVSIAYKTYDPKDCAINRISGCKNKVKKVGTIKNAVTYKNDYWNATTKRTS